MIDFYKGKRVFVTGHTGFKGSWLCEILKFLGASVTGFSLEPESGSLYELCSVHEGIESHYRDIREYSGLYRAFEIAQPEIVFHLAAQPLVSEGYVNPVDTYETNVCGTVNLLECTRQTHCVSSFVNITTDKVYKRLDCSTGYSEEITLDGYDPYANSKSCSELVTACYRRSYFDAMGVAISTARAGNVIGGGDIAKNRIIPDCIRAALNKQPVAIRHPDSVRPYQFVLEPLFAYLSLALKQSENKSAAGCYNIGPSIEDCVSTKELVQYFCEAWGEGMSYECQDSNEAFNEASLLYLDCSRIRAKLGWIPKYDIKTAVEKTVVFSKSANNHKDVMTQQIKEYFELID